MSKEIIYKIVVAVTTAIVAIAAAICLPSCTALRTIHTETTAVSAKDTIHVSSVISEKYTAKKKAGSIN